MGSAFAADVSADSACAQSLLVAAAPPPASTPGQVAHACALEAAPVGPHTGAPAGAPAGAGGAAGLLAGLPLLSLADVLGRAASAGGPPGDTRPAREQGREPAALTSAAAPPEEAG